MPRYTSAYSSFVSRLDEVIFFKNCAASKERKDPITLHNEINAFCRAAIVLLSAHFEAYIKEIGEVALVSIHAKSVPRAKLSPRLYYHISKDILDELITTTEPEKIAEKIFLFINADLPYWSRTGVFPQSLPIERFNRGFASPAFKKINSYFNRFGYSDYKYDLTCRMKAQYSATINMVDHLVDIRNKIAHGDIRATKTPSEVGDMISIIRFFCRMTDLVFTKWCKRNLCSIK